MRLERADEYDNKRNDDHETAHGKENVLQYLIKYPRLTVHLVLNAVLACFLCNAAHVLFLLLEECLLYRRDYQDYSQKHHSHRRSQSDFLILERRFYRLDNERTGSILALGDDVRYLENGYSALYREYELESYDRTNAREHDVPETLPCVGTVEVSSLIDIRGYRLYRAYIHNYVKADVAPDRREHQAYIDKIRVAEPPYRLASEQHENAVERTLGVGDAVALLEKAAKYQGNCNAVHHVGEEEYSLERIAELDLGAEHRSDEQSECLLNKRTYQIVDGVRESLKIRAVGEYPDVIVEAYPFPANAELVALLEAVYSHVDCRDNREQYQQNNGDQQKQQCCSIFLPGVAFQPLHKAALLCGRSRICRHRSSFHRSAVRSRVITKVSAIRKGRL